MNQKDYDFDVNPDLIFKLLDDRINSFFFSVYHHAQKSQQKIVQKVINDNLHIKTLFWYFVHLIALAYFYYSFIASKVI